MIRKESLWHLEHGVVYYTELGNLVIKMLMFVRNGYYSHVLRFFIINGIKKDL